MYIKQIDRNPEIYQIISEWLNKRPGWQPLHRSMLADTTYMVFDDTDTPLVSGCLYLPTPKASGTIGWVEWILANPDTTHEQREPAFELLNDVLNDVAKAYKVSVLFTTGQEGHAYTKRAEKMGFSIIERNMVAMIKPVI